MIRRFALVVGVAVAALGSPRAFAKPPTASRASGPVTGTIAGTVVERTDLALILPGLWTEKPLDGGVEFWRGEQEQLIASVYGPPDGKRGNDAVQMVSTVQRLAIEQVCESGIKVGNAEHVSAKGSGLVAVRFVASCEKPRMTSTLIAATAHERVLSLEYYDYHATPNLAAHTATVTKILGTVRIKPASAKPAR